MSNLYRGDSFFLSFISNTMVILAITCSMIGFISIFMNRNNKNLSLLDLLSVIGIFILIPGFLFAKNSYYENQYDNIKREGYTIIKQYSGFSDKSLPDTSSCNDQDSVKFLDINFNEVHGIANAYIVICR